MLKIYIYIYLVNYECTDRCFVCVSAGWEDWRWYFLSVYWHGSTWLMQHLNQIPMRPMKRITAILQVDVTVWSTGLVSWGTGHVGMWHGGHKLRFFPSCRRFLGFHNTDAEDSGFPGCYSEWQPYWYPMLQRKVSPSPWFGRHRIFF